MIVLTRQVTEADQEAAVGMVVVAETGDVPNVGVIFVAGGIRGARRGALPFETREVIKGQA